MVRCPNIDEDTGDPCGCDLQLKDRFCSQCGWKIERSIFLSPTCQAVLEDGTVCATALPKKCKFCPGCGTRVVVPKHSQDLSSVTVSSSFSTSEYPPTDVSSSFTFNPGAKATENFIVPSTNAQSSDKNESPQTNVKQAPAEPSITTTSEGVSTSERKVATLKLRLSVPPVTLIPDKSEGQIKLVSGKVLPYQRCTSVPEPSPSENVENASRVVGEVSQELGLEDHSQSIGQHHQDVSPPEVTVDDSSLAREKKEPTSLLSSSSTAAPHSSFKISSHGSPKRPPPGPVKVIHGLQQFSNADKSNSQRLSEARDKLRKYNKSAVMRKSHSMDDLSMIESVTESSIPCINVGDKKIKSVSPRRAKKSKNKDKKSSNKKIAAMFDGQAEDNRPRSTEARGNVIATEVASAASDTDGDTTYLNDDTDHTSVDTVTEWTEASVSIPKDEELPLDDEVKQGHQDSPQNERSDQQGSRSAVEGCQADLGTEGQKVDSQSNSNDSSGQSSGGQNEVSSDLKKGSHDHNGEESEEESSGLTTQSKENAGNNDQGESEGAKKEKKKRKEKRERKKKKVPTATLR